MFSPKSVANYFLELAQAQGEPLDPMKLQKLIYYAHGWYAGYRGAPLIDEAIEAWPYGPVIPSVYEEFKRYGAGAIAAKASSFVDGHPQEVAPPSDPEIRAFLQNIWKSYSRYTGIALSEMTHAPGSPWDITRKQTNGVRGADIPFEAIADHFRVAVAAVKQAAAVAA